MKPPFRRNLLPASVEFICRYWPHRQIVEDYHIGQAVNAALALREAAK